MMHITSMKDRTKNKTIAPIGPPSHVYIPLSEKFGNKPKPLVKVGDSVKRYQVVGEAKEGFSAKIHSPISGKVIEIREYLQVGGKNEQTIIIENDYLDTEEELNPPLDYKHLPASDLLKIIEDAGIVGEGGAEFPAALKYKLDGKNVETFIINAAECEPYLTCDYAIMSQRTDEFFEAILIINQILNATDIIIGIEDDTEELKEIFRPYFEKKEYEKIRLVLLPSEYPQGGELQLIRSLTDIEMPDEKNPIEVGVIVSNVGTIHAVYEAVVHGKPRVERVITVSGEKSKECGNFLVGIGTPVSHIIREVGVPDKNTFVVVGGAMMGKGLTELTVPVTKGSTGVLLLQKNKFDRLNCIWCSYCVEVCPMFLMPMKYEELYRKGRYKDLKKYDLESCIDCGSCEYACPSNVPLLESIQKGKSKLKEMSDAAK